MRNPQGILKLEADCSKVEKTRPSLKDWIPTWVVLNCQKVLQYCIIACSISQASVIFIFNQDLDQFLYQKKYRQFMIANPISIFYFIFQFSSSSTHSPVYAFVLNLYYAIYNCIYIKQIQFIIKNRKNFMINFASLFNQFRMGSSSIGDLIDSPGVTIDRLLDEDSFSNQFKSGNSKVQQFMKYDKYQTLVKYITEVGPPEDRKRSYKYPLSACQLLSSDNNQTLEFFFGQNPLIVKEQVVEKVAKVSNGQAQSSSQEKQKPENIVVIDDKIEPQQAIQSTNVGSQQKKNEQQTHNDSMEQEKKVEANPSEEQVQTRTKVIEREVDPLRIALFSYFKAEVNYTLAGYVCKVFNAFFTKKPVSVMKFLLDSQRFNQMLNHIESRSVGELIVKLLTQQSGELLEQRKNAFQSLLEKISKNDEVFVLSNLSSPLCEIIEKVSTSVKANNETSIELSHLYFTPTIITQIIDNVMSNDENVSVYNAPVLLTYLTNVPLVIPENSQITEDLKTQLMFFLRKTLEKLKVKRQQKPSLGFGRIKIVEIMSFVLKENILNARELAASEVQFFPALLALCKQYQYNNILHNEVLKIIDIALNEPETSNFLQSLFREDIFLKFLVNESEEDQKIRAGSGPQKSRKGYVGHIVALCRKIQQYQNKNDLIAKFNERKQFQKIIENLVNKEIYDYNKSLAGYSMKRGTKHPILFGKDEVIQEHIRFLAATPPPVFQAEPQHINIEHPDLSQAENIQVQIAREEVAKEQQQKQIQQQEETYDPRFFERHLNYNVQDLMNDL